MTTFNAAGHVAAAVASILKQTERDLEFIVEDDGSTDGTVDILRRVRDPRFQLLQVPRCGRIAALNLGFRAATAPFIANQDADDVALPDRLRQSVDYLATHPRVALLGSGRVPLIDEAGVEYGFRDRPTKPAALRRALGYSMPFFHSSCTYRRRALDEVGCFDEGLPFFEDYDLWVRLAAHWDVANLPVAPARKRRHLRQAFDERHWTNEGYRTRARIMLRYVRHVRRDPRVLLRATLFLVMGPRLRLAWLRIAGRDRLELDIRRQMTTIADAIPRPGQRPPAP